MTNKSYHDHQVALQRVIKESMQMLKRNPTSIPALGRMGDAYLQLNIYDKAIDAYQRVMSVDSKNVSGLIGLATVYVLTSKLDKAISTAMRALDTSPGNMHAFSIIAAVYERQREVEKIIELFKHDIDSGNRNPILVMPYARALSQKKEVDSAVLLLKESLDHPANSGEYLITTHFLLGKLYDKLSDYDVAFKHFEKANKLRYVYFDTTRPTLEQENIRRRFTKAFMKNRAFNGVSSDRPVFIVGMPRSGTTLVDRIISSHPDAESAGELVALPQLVESMCQSFGLGSGHFTNCIETLSNEQLSSIANQYLKVLEKDHNGAMRITDKMPVNFMYLGMIEVLFPNARIINCIRNPADLCLSCYFQDFHGFKPFLNKLDEIAMVYRNYRLLMDHWKSVLSLQIHDIEYESLVAAPDKEIERLIDFIGLPWNEKCLSFHKEGQFINTVSYDQVDKPIYQSSISRWKHYEKYMEPLKASLGEYWPGD